MPPADSWRSSCWQETAAASTSPCSNAFSMRRTRSRTVPAHGTLHDMSLIRRRFLQFLVAVAGLHALAIAGYYMFDIEGSTAARQRIYAWAWMGLTVAVVVVGLQRIKRARRAGR